MMRAYLRRLALVCLFPSLAYASTYVGNPNRVTSLLAGSNGIEWLVGYLEADLYDAVDCAPGISTCLATAPVDAPMILDGELIANGNAVSLRLAIDEILFPPLGPNVDRDALILEMGAPDWTTAAQLSPSGGPVVVTPGHPLYEVLVDELISGSALFFDADGDGLLSPAERAQGPLVTALSP